MKKGIPEAQLAKLTLENQRLRAEVKKAYGTARSCLESFSRSVKEGVQLREENQRLRMPQWHLVTESLPYFGVEVLVTDGNRTLIGYRQELKWTVRGWKWQGAGMCSYESEWAFADDCNGVSPIIAWMAVPRYN